jgi:DNA replication protein DnaC
MNRLVPPTDDGYGWPMEAADRLKGATERRAQLDRERAERRKRTPEQSRQHRGAVMQTVLEMARRQGVALEKIRPATDEEMNAAIQRADLEHKQRQAEIRLRTIPPIYRDATPDPASPEARQAAQWVAAYRSGARRNLLILGNPGTGKTYLAAAVLRSLLLKDFVPAVFITAKSMMDALRPSSGTGDVDMQLFKLAPVLLMDDLGAERVSDFVVEQLTDLANDRVQHRRPTIITTNLQPAGLKELYKDRRLIERLFGNCDVIRMTGQTRREMAEGFE